MKSPKQDVLCQLVGHGFATLRALQSAGANGMTEWILKHRAVFNHGFALADLLHLVHGSITEPGFVENDITFINFAIPSYLRAVGADVDLAVLKRLVAFYDAVPEELHDRLTWWPTPAMREISARVEY